MLQVSKIARRIASARLPGQKQRMLARTVIVLPVSDFRKTVGGVESSSPRIFRRDLEVDGRTQQGIRLIEQSLKQFARNASAPKLSLDGDIEDLKFVGHLPVNQIAENRTLELGDTGSGLRKTEFGLEAPPGTGTGKGFAFDQRHLKKIARNHRSCPDLRDGLPHSPTSERALPPT